LQNVDFLSNDHPRKRNSHLRTKFDRNRMIHGRDIKIKLFSKWRPSAILNFRSLQFLSRDLYWHVIFHLRSKFRINRTIWRRDLCPKRFSKWRPFDILNLQNFDVFWSEVQTRNGNLHLHTKFDGNRIIHS